MCTSPVDVSRTTSGLRPEYSICALKRSPPMELVPCTVMFAAPTSIRTLAWSMLPTLAVESSVCVPVGIVGPSATYAAAPTMATSTTRAAAISAVGPFSARRTTSSSPITIRISGQRSTSRSRRSAGTRPELTSRAKTPTRMSIAGQKKLRYL
ncbi:MAG: hypothetical protein E6J40_08085 [Chloroflexi bacterium]|nr:MAG: hypothetical protein E6J40_08085 [Chloroflexota bacterium]